MTILIGYALLGLVIFIIGFAILFGVMKATNAKSLTEALGNIILSIVGVFVCIGTGWLAVTLTHFFSK